MRGNNVAFERQEKKVLESKHLRSHNVAFERLFRMPMSKSVAGIALVSL